jgi:transcriptional regulator with PAS, ATPase and Fis domain
MRFTQIEMGAGDDGLVEALRSALDAPEIRLLLDRLPDGVIAIDRDGTIAAMNSAAAAINAIRAVELIGRKLTVLAERSAIDWTEIADCYYARRQGEFLTQTENGRSVLTSIRQFRDDVGEVELTLLVQRDLQVLDHVRRSAVGTGRRDVFKFLADREIAPDFVMQRRISPAVDRVIGQGERALRQGARILLSGESGSGKTEIAKYLHRTADAPETPFIHVNCGAIPESLFESEMFGYEKGAFTGALQTGKKGLIEAAEGGTLFLDEVGEIPLPSQAKLLKFLEDGIVQRLGARSGRRLKTRVISATNRDLWQMCRAGRFRRDLYYRLAVIPLEVAPLRHQPTLVDHLIEHFLSAVNQTRERRLRLAPDCRARLRAYAFPGNIRELHNVMQQLSVAAAEEAAESLLPPYMIGAPAAAAVAPPDHLAAAAPRREPEGTGASDVAPLKERVRAFERQLINDAIARHGSKRKAARALGIDIGTIVRKTRRGPCG